MLKSCTSIEIKELGAAWSQEVLNPACRGYPSPTTPADLTHRLRTGLDALESENSSLHSGNAGSERGDLAGSAHN